MELADRIATIIKVNQLTAATFADRIGVQRSSISHILNGRNKPSMDFIEKVLLHFPRVDPGWLITGKSAGRLQDDGRASTNQDDIASDSGALPTEVKPKVDAIMKSGSGKKIERIVIFYSDRTFETYDP